MLRLVDKTGAVLGAFRATEFVSASLAGTGGDVLVRLANDADVLVRCGWRSPHTTDVVARGIATEALTRLAADVAAQTDATVAPLAIADQWGGTLAVLRAADFVSASVADAQDDARTAAVAVVVRGRAPLSLTCAARDGVNARSAAAEVVRRAADAVAASIVGPLRRLCEARDAAATTRFLAALTNSLRGADAEAHLHLDAVWEEFWSWRFDRGAAEFKCAFAAVARGAGATVRWEGAPPADYAPLRDCAVVVATEGDARSLRAELLGKLTQYPAVKALHEMGAWQFTVSAGGGRP
jgi:hypothetical protein